MRGNDGGCATQQTQAVSNTPSWSSRHHLARAGITRLSSTIVFRSGFAARIVARPFDEHPHGFFGVGLGRFRHPFLQSFSPIPADGRGHPQGDELDPRGGTAMNQLLIGARSLAHSLYHAAKGAG
jgi:hypothetical protein